MPCFSTLPSEEQRTEDSEAFSAAVCSCRLLKRAQSNHHSKGGPGSRQAYQPINKRCADRVHQRGLGAVWLLIINRQRTVSSIREIGLPTHPPPGSHFKYTSQSNRQGVCPMFPQCCCEVYGPLVIYFIRHASNLMQIIGSRGLRTAHKYCKPNPNFGYFFLYVVLILNSKLWIMAPSPC